MTVDLPTRPPTASPGQPMHRVLPPGPQDLAAHRHRVGPLPHLAAGELLGMLQAAGLTGRGGGGFPTWRKLAAVLEATAGRPGRAVVVANAAEGEPASSKDAALLAAAPHLVLDGLDLLAAATGSQRTHVYAPRGALPGLDRALTERAHTGWAAVAPALVPAPDTFLAGEESAVVAAVVGRRALPWDRTAPVAHRGVGGLPTLVGNVETLAHVALIARWGPEWFRSVGSADDPGTRLLTLSGSVGDPGVVEVPGSVPLATVLAAGGTSPDSLRAVLIGGYHGTWVAGAGLAGTRLSRAAGTSPGAGVVVALGRDRCGLRTAASITGWLAAQSAGQCGPCRNGLPAAALALARLAGGDRDQELPGEIARLAAAVDGRGSCRHPDGTARFLRSTLTEFADDVTAHLAGGCEAAG